MSAVMVVAWSVFTLQMMIKIGALKKMAPESRMDQIPRRIGLLFKIGIGQEKLVGRSRERMPGIMHALIFWGAMLIGIREVTLMGEGFVHGFQEYLPLLGSNYLSGFLFIYLYNIAELVVLLMILVALYRRFVPRPDRLDLNWEGVYVLIFIAGIMLTDLLFDAARFNLIDEWQYSLHQFEHPVYGQERSWAPVASALAGLLVGLGETSNSFFYHFGFWGHIATMLVFVNILINTKQFHEITALPNVFLGSLDYPHARQKWIDLEDEKAWEDGKIGINSLEQLTWKQGLDLYSCTECGRCYDVCPTYVTGKPLTQKWVNQSLLSHLRKEEGNIYVLVQARIEPGNSRIGHFGPTIQSTPANYMRLHGGKSTPYLEYFFGCKPKDARVIGNSMQYDLGKRYYQKSKTLIYVEVPEFLETDENMI